MNVERLQTLANYLRNYNRVSFFDRIMSLFGFLGPKKKEFNMQLWTCDTAACALGVACQIPEFKSAGLVASIVDEEDDEWDENGNRVFHAIPEFDGDAGFSAGARFFGISHHAASYLFDPATYADHEFWFDEPAPPITPERVADRIDELLANDGEPLEPDDWERYSI